MRELTEQQTQMKKLSQQQIAGRNAGGGPLSRFAFHPFRLSSRDLRHFIPVHHFILLFKSLLSLLINQGGS